MRDFFADIDWSRWSETIWTTGARVILIALGIYIALRIIQRILEPAIRTAISAQQAGVAQSEIDKRVETLFHVAYRTISIVAVVVGLLTILPEFGINVAALIAGAGIIGVAIGFGSQSLVKDVISGLFILIENQFSRGDVVNVAGVGGQVVDVNLRRTLLRDLDGAVHSVPNGEIHVASNLTRAQSRVNMLVTVSYGDDLDRVFEVINRTAEAQARDPAWSADIIEAAKVLGVEGFGESGVDIRILGETQPIRQGDVIRDLRLRLKKAFDAEGIEIPFPHRTLVTAGRNAADGIVIRQAEGPAVRAG